jgi:FtsZ-binding cell division protein ZapB
MFISLKMGQSSSYSSDQSQISLEMDLTSASSVSFVAEAKEINQLTDQVEILNVVVNELHNKNNGLMNRIDELQNENVELKKVCDELKNHHAAWKVKFESESLECLTKGDGKKRQLASPSGHSSQAVFDVESGHKQSKRQVQLLT